MELRLSREFDAIAGLHAAIEEFCAWEDLGPEVVFSLQLAVEELFTNLIKYNPGSDDPIGFYLIRSADQLVVRLTATDCDFFDPQSAQLIDVTAPLADRTAGGLGLHLVRAYVDVLETDYRDRTLRITALKNLEAPDVRSPAP